MYEKVEEMAKGLLNRVHIKPTVAIICGSGLGDIGNLIENPKIIPYNTIPEFPVSTGNLNFAITLEIYDFIKKIFLSVWSSG